VKSFYGKLRRDLQKKNRHGPDHNYGHRTINTRRNAIEEEKIPEPEESPTKKRRTVQFWDDMEIYGNALQTIEEANQEKVITNKSNVLGFTIKKT